MENPTSYIARKLQNTEEIKVLYIADNVLYFDIMPSKYNLAITVGSDMSDVVIDNRIADIQYIYFHEEQPDWPVFTGNQPLSTWTAPYLILMGDLL
jgi:hypothetical protein